MFVDAADELFDATSPYTADFFEVLHRFVQAEPWLTRDKVMIDDLRTIGIAKGKAFGPDPATRQLLTEAAQEAHEWLDAAYEAAGHGQVRTVQRHEPCPNNNANPRQLVLHAQKNG